MAAKGNTTLGLAGIAKSGPGPRGRGGAAGYPQGGNLQMNAGGPVPRTATESLQRSAQGTGRGTVTNTNPTNKGRRGSIPQVLNDER